MKKSELVEEITKRVLDTLYETVKANRALGKNSIHPDGDDTFGGDDDDEVSFSGEDDDTAEMTEVGSQKKSKSLVGVPSNWNKSKTIGKKPPPPKQKTQKRVFPY